MSMPHPHLVFKIHAITVQENFDKRDKKMHR
jgi:hypothetical protein